MEDSTLKRLINLDKFDILNSSNTTETDEDEIMNKVPPDLTGLFAVFNEDWKELFAELKESHDNMNKLVFQLKIANHKTKSLSAENMLFREHIVTLRNDLKLRNEKYEEMKINVLKLKEKTNSQLHVKYTCPVCDSGSGISRYITDYWKNISREEKQKPQSVINEILKKMSE